MNSRILLFFFAVTMNLVAIGQTTAKNDAESVKNPYGKDYYKAQFEDGDSCFNVYIKKNLHYPDAAREINTEGRVLVRFFVNEKGESSNIMVVKGIGSGCDEEARRVVSSMPKWKPAYYKKRPVRSVVTLPIQFKLE